MLPIGTKVYYTGDMANQDGHFEVFAYRGSSYDLLEIDGERKFLGVYHIAEVYKGHCGDRFVTQQAWQDYREARIAEMQRDEMRRSYLKHQQELEQS